jgi:Protein of unknown function (DUF1616)
MRLKNIDLIVGLAIVILNIVCMLVPLSPIWLDTILALPLIFVLPGYVLTEALFYRRKIAGSHRLVLTFGLSIAIVILSGLLLNLLVPGLQRVSWVVCLSLCIVVGICIVMIRREKVEEQQIRIRWLRVYEYILFCLALGGIIFALNYASEGVVQQPHPGFTQLWVLPVGGSRCAVSLGIHSFELSPVAYSLSVTANGVLVPTQMPSVLKVGEQVERTIELPQAAMRGDTIDVRAQLYRLDEQGEMYRSVNIMLYRSGGVIGQCRS